MTTANKPRRGISWKSLIIATLSVVFGVMVLTAIFVSRAPAAASGRTSTSEQLFPPQYVTTPTPIIVTNANSAQGRSSSNSYLGGSGYATSGSGGNAKNSSGATYTVWHDTYKTVASNQNTQPNYQTWQSQSGYNGYGYNGYGYNGYGNNNYSVTTANYPTWHDPWPYGYPQGYATYPNYPVWHN